MINYPIYAEDDSQKDIKCIFEVTEQYELISKENIETNGEQYIRYVFKDKNNSSYTFNDKAEEYSETFIYLLSPVSNSKTAGTEYPSFINYSVNATINYNYTKYTSSGVGYFRLNSLQCSNITVESGCTFKKVVLGIYNNGIGASVITSGQSKTQTYYSTSGGTLYGISTWTPSTSYDTTSPLNATMFSVRIYITRGTGSYDDDWARSF